MVYASDGPSLSLMSLIGHFARVALHPGQQDHRQVMADQVSFVLIPHETYLQ